MIFKNFKDVIKDVRDNFTCNLTNRLYLTETFIEELSRNENRETFILFASNIFKSLLKQRGIHLTRFTISYLSCIIININITMCILFEKEPEIFTGFLFIPLKIRNFHGILSALREIFRILFSNSENIVSLIIFV